MKVRVLGCSGGASAGLRTTALRVDEDILIDAGSGVGELTLAEMRSIRHIFLTHSHLDHLAFLPFLIDAIFEHITEPITLHGQPQTLKAVQDHIFNWTIWPDFAALPQPDCAVLRYQGMNAGETREIDGRRFEMIRVNHSVSGVGYCVEAGGGVFAFSGDTTTNDNFWDVLNARDRLDLLVVEVAFRNAQQRLAEMSYHYCPRLLAADLAKLRHTPEICLTHLKPGDEDTIVAECRHGMPNRTLTRLVGGEIFQL